MQPAYISVSVLLGFRSRHTVPLVQRAYVWSQEDQREPSDRLPQSDGER